MKLKFIVAGSPVNLITNARNKLARATESALNLAGSIASPAGMEVRDVDGRLLDQGVTLKALGVVEGQTLFVNPVAGVGGNVPKPKSYTETEAYRNGVALAYAED
jgi:hypothetical protein